MCQLRDVLPILLLCLGHVSGQQCNWQYDLLPNQPINISSSNYPRALPAGSQCIYQLHAPESHVVHLTCRFEVYPDRCDSKFFYISLDGDTQFQLSERFCRMGQITRISNFQSLAFGYQSIRAPSQQMARLSCQAVARYVPCQCGWGPPPQRITNGVQATRHEFPSMVAIRDLDSNLSMICGGSIISSRYILTAAHCMDRQPLPSRLRALVGYHNIRSARDSMFASEHAISKIIVHPAYDATKINNDIALLQTVRNMVWSRGVAPICLPYRPGQLGESYKVVDIAGWGILGFSSTQSNTLQKAKLMTITNPDCKSRYNETILPQQICSFDYTGMGQDSCQHDSGGPLILQQSNRRILLGVISFGRSCGQRYGVGVNTRVSSYMAWIGQYVGNSTCIV